MDDSRRKLIWHGMFLFLLGLLTGFMETKFANPRMGLAAHLEGVMNGTFLIALGAVWMEVRLAAEAEGRSVLVRAVWSLCELGGDGAGGGAGGGGAFSDYRCGTHALPWQETLLTALFMSVGLAIVGSAVLVLWGLRRGSEVNLTTETRRHGGTQQDSSLINTDDENKPLALSR